MPLKTEVFIAVHHCWDPQGRANSTVENITFLGFTIRLDRGIVPRRHIFAAVEVEVTRRYVAHENKLYTCVHKGRCLMIPVRDSDAYILESGLAKAGNVRGVFFV